MTASGRTPPSPDRRDGGVYVHVPFCASICRYCHFARTDRHGDAERRAFVDGVLAELDLRRARCAALSGGRRGVRTLYVGGGTPSVLAPTEFARLLDGLRARLDLSRVREITAEANPESFDAAAADAWRAAGVDRVSLGVQSLDPDVLAWLGRAADPARNRAALRLATARFPRVSADWILAPGCRADRLAAEFREARDLGVDHVSFYVLEWHPHTGLARDRARGLVRPDGDARIEALYLAGREALEALGYRAYEVSNFALPGAESLHNSAYWERRPYLGLGPGAHGQWGRRRAANHGALERWSADVAAGRLPEAETETLDAARVLLERTVLALRTERGCDLAPVRADAAALAAGEAAGLWTAADGRLRLTPRGLLRIDDVEEWLAARLPRARRRSG